MSAVDTFSVSVKGVLKVDGRLLLRRNERQEFELLGGRLERTDESLEARLATEFLEESGIEVEVREAREPWLYLIGTKSVLIVPFVCRPLRIPKCLCDMDGGTLHYVSPDELRDMPLGYMDTIAGTIPRTSRSAPAAPSPKPSMPVPMDRFFVEVRVRDGTDVLLRSFLTDGCAPGDFINERMGERGGGRPVFVSSALEYPHGAAGDGVVILSYEMKARGRNNAPA